MPSVTGAFIIVCVLLAIVCLWFVKLVYDFHRKMTDALTDDGEQRPTETSDKKPPPKRYFGEP